MTQLSVGFQLAGQAYSQIVFFQDQRSFKEFTSGRVGGLIWGLATWMKSVPAPLWFVLPRRARGWGLVFLALSGGFDMVRGVFRSTILQVATPDELRGRLQGVFIVVVAGGPRLGDALAGTMATAFGETFAIVAGGTACVLVVSALAARFTSFARYDARDPVA